ncbi:MAG: hypothetical protein JWP12_3175 [Bacteroidetes bacterium]|nr:hypothetical protein [Bacteroidota bacterium]
MILSGIFFSAITIISGLLIGIIVLILLLAIIMKKDYFIQSEIVINRPKEDVLNYVKLLRNQEKYSKWVMQDPNVKLDYKGTDGTVGFIAAWKSDVKNVGVGEQEIKNIRENGYDAEVRFEKPFKGISQAHVTLEADGAKTKVTTRFDTRTPFPMSFMIPMIKGMLTKDMDENSANLKRNLENR